MQAEAVVRRCSIKMMFLKISQKSQGTPIKLQVACNLIKKEALTQVFSCEFGEVFKNTFFYNNSGGCFYTSSQIIVSLQKETIFFFLSFTENI